MRMQRCRSCQAVTCFARPFGRGVRYFIVTTAMPFSLRNRRAGATSKPPTSLNWYAPPE